MVVVGSGVDAYGGVVGIVHTLLAQLVEGDVAAIPLAGHGVAAKGHVEAQPLVDPAVVHIAQQEVVVVLVVAYRLLAVVAFVVAWRVVGALQLAELVVHVETGAQVEREALDREVDVDRDVAVYAVFLVGVELLIERAVGVVVAGRVHDHAGLNVGGRVAALEVLVAVHLHGVAREAPCQQVEGVVGAISHHRHVVALLAGVGCLGVELYPLVELRGAREVHRLLLVAGVGQYPVVVGVGDAQAGVAALAVAAVDGDGVVPRGAGFKDAGVPVFLVHPGHFGVHAGVPVVALVEVAHLVGVIFLAEAVAAVVARLGNAVAGMVGIDAPHAEGGVAQVAARAVG